MIFYRVGNNESVSAIANRFSVPVYSVIEDNKMCCEPEEGDILLIEEKRLKRYRVKPGDTIESVALKLNVSARTLTDINKINYLIVNADIYY